MKFTIVKSINPISKKFNIDGDSGELVKSDGGNLTLAEFHTQDGLTISGLHDFMVGELCTPKTILIPGITDFNTGWIVTKKEIKNREDEDITDDVVARSKDYFRYKGGAGFILLDYDPSSDYTQNDGEILSKDDLLKILYEVIPEIKDSPHLWKTSSSSCISNSDTGETLRGINGQHIFIAIKNTADIERIVDIFYKRLWLNGHGYVFIDKAGRMHDRTIIDRVVNSPEREIFLKADCLKPAAQEIEYEVFNPDNKLLNTENITDLTISDTDKYIRLVDIAKAKRAGLSEKIRNDFIEKNHEKLGISKSKLQKNIEHQLLFNNNPIIMSNGVEVIVHDLFADPDKYDGEYCYDPLEPEYGGPIGGSTKGWIDINNRRIFSHAHGGIEYALENSDRKSAREIALEVCDNSDHKIMFRMASQKAYKMNFISTELDQLVDYITKYAKLKKGSCHKTFYEFYKRLTGKSDKTGSVDLDYSSGLIDHNGNIDQGMIQSNISAPVTLKFPHTVTRGENVLNLDTFENFEFMTMAYAIKFSYDMVLKLPEIAFPNDLISGGDNKMNASLSRLKSLCVLNGLGKDSVNYVAEMVNDNQKNPVLDWITRTKWDGNPRMDLIVENIKIANYGNSDDDDINRKFSEGYKKKVLRMWFLQCIAALDGGLHSPLSTVEGIAVPKYEYILVFAGGQGIQKTKFIKSLLPNELKQYILTGHELDLKDKDSIKIGISHWITELGELDSTFKKSDISSLKAFMSKEDDQIRMPYAATESKFIRRTSFCGSVNEIQFLVDKTGNRRMLPIEAIGLNPLYLIETPDGKNMGDPEHTQQFWAEIYSYYMDGELWWPDEELDKMLTNVVNSHDRIDPTVEALEDKFDFEKNDEWRFVNRIKGEQGINHIGEALKFVTMNMKEIAIEIDVNATDYRVVNLISNYLSSHGISRKPYKVDGRMRKAVRLCVKRGVNLKRDFVAPGDKKV